MRQYTGIDSGNKPAKTWPKWFKLKPPDFGASAVSKRTAPKLATPPLRRAMLPYLNEK